MRRRPLKWRTGFPPSTGWWNASVCREERIWRWFDADSETWSYAEWRWYWPENARVPPSGRPE